MPTVIDTLVVELGLDPKKLSQGQREAIQAFRRTQEEAKKQGDLIEEQQRRIGNVIGTLQRRLIGFGAAMFGASGVIDFAKNVTTADASLYRLARRLGTQPEVIAKWGNATRLAGGEASSMNNFMSSLSNELERAAATGQSTLLPLLNAMGGGFTDATGKVKDLDLMMKRFTEAIGSQTPQRQVFWLRELGATEDVINLLIMEGRERDKLLKQSEASARAAAANAAEADKLSKSWASAALAAENFGRAILSKIGGGGFLDRLAESFNENAELVRQGKFASVGGGYAQPGAEGEMDVMGGVRAKPGAGRASVAAQALAGSLQRDIPGLQRFTAFDDAHHGGRGAHGAGRAVDFTLADPRTAAAVAAQVSSKLKAMGVDATVLDEYNQPSRFSTGGHIHVQFNSAESAAAFARQAAGGKPGEAAGATTTNTVNIQRIEVNTQAKDADGVARDLGGLIKRAIDAGRAESGLQ